MIYNADYFAIWISFGYIPGHLVSFKERPMKEHRLTCVVSSMLSGLYTRRCVQKSNMAVEDSNVSDV